MNFNLLIGVDRLVVLLVVDLALLAFLAYPCVKRYGDDQGDGNALVLLPKPILPPFWRLWALIAIFLTMFIVYFSLKGSLDPNTAYANVVTRISEAVVRSPSEVNGYMAGFSLGLRFLVFGTMVCLAIMGRGNILRRTVVLYQAFLYLFVMAFVDATLVVIEVVFEAPIAPTTLFGNFIALAVGTLAMARMQYGNYALPKASTVPFVKRPRLADATVLIGVTLASMAICMTGLLLIFHLANPKYQPVLAILLPVPFAPVALGVRTALLALVNLFTIPPEPPVGDDRPPIDVIIPAFNEAEVIGDTLRAIDVAAGHYGGPVQVILMNDGSTDDTADIANACIDRFRYATGTVHHGRHGGKSESLNAALKLATTDLVVRIDADTIIGEKSLYYLPRWFQYPEIGLMEPMCYPRNPNRRAFTPYMRLFEEMRQFGANHMTMRAVDGVNVVPGVFTAFRRAPAVELGGFTVGMNGEDGDFTMRFSRLGYRTWMDPKIVVFEDVPPTLVEIREQRVRWSRAIHHNQSRHGPYRAGIATPKVWFNQTSQFFKSTLSPARLLLPIYLILLAIFEGENRNVILAFFGTYILAQMVFIVFEMVVMTKYRQVKKLPWILLWPFWHVCLIAFATEAWISMPGRPLGVHGTRPVAVTQAVIH
jgi:cellulose synthase/poly-beta-1,6-N-acetylglucosamine synthase-like glycosyltransferase